MFTVVPISAKRSYRLNGSSELTMKHSVKAPSILRTPLLLALLALGLGFTTSVQASAAGRTAPGCAPGTVKTLVKGHQSYAVDVRGLVRAYRSPGGKNAFARFGPLNVNGVP